ncbi:hypothetical protein D049_1038A, partial [Vibrio parahaemolyticus VPTS-2010]
MFSGEPKLAKRYAARDSVTVFEEAKYS